MKKILFLFAATLLLFSSCHTREKVLYFQDVQEQQKIATQALAILKFQPGDKLTIIVSSSKPELAMPFNLPIVTTQTGAVSGRSTSNQVAVYTINAEGNVDIPVLGTVHIAGLTRGEVEAEVQKRLRESGLLTDAIVIVNAYDQHINVLGEVKSPGKINISKDNLTILEAISMAGDLTIHARRDRILVLRQEGDVTTPYYVDIRSKDIFNSPVYNLRQNDCVYVEPNKVRTGQSTVNDNNLRSVTTWMSIFSFLTSMGILIFRD